MSRPVLIVEDDRDLVEAMELLLVGAGHDVVTARDGREALDRVAERMPGVILLDMRMPGMNGWEFAREFRSRYQRSAPIVMVTAAEDVAKRAAEIDAEDYLGKPFEISAVLDVVHRFVG